MLASGERPRRENAIKPRSGARIQPTAQAVGTVGKVDRSPEGAKEKTLYCGIAWALTKNRDWNRLQPLEGIANEKNDHRPDPLSHRCACLEPGPPLFRSRPAPALPTLSRRGE